jgi:hypothetical protein
MPVIFLEYWKIVRQKAGFTGDAVNPEVTIQATDMSKEKLGLGCLYWRKIAD